MVLFISLTLIMCSAVAAENLTTTEQGEVNGGVYSHAVQKTPYGNQQAGGNLEEVSFNITNKEESNINPQKSADTGTPTNSYNTGSVTESTQTIKDIQNARLYTMVYVQSTNNRYGAVVNISLDGDNDGSYETVLENNRVLQIASSQDGTVYTVNENITRVYSDYLLSYDIANYIHADTLNVKVQTYSGQDMGVADAKIKCVGLLAAYNVDSSNERYTYWFNTGHSWTNEKSETTFATTGKPRPETATLIQVATSSSKSDVYVNGISFEPENPSGYFSESVWDVLDVYDEESDIVLENEATGGLYGATFKTVAATLVLTYTETNPEPVVKVDKVKVSSNGGDALVYVTNNIQATLSNEGSQLDTAKLTLNVGDFSQSVDISNLDNNPQTFTFNYTTDEKNDYELSLVLDYLNGTVETIYSDNLVVKYNGYMGKSFTGGENFTEKHEYKGLNTLVIIPVHDYQSADWQRVTSTINASKYGLDDMEKIVDILYYQPYNWDYGYVMNTYQLSINDLEISPIAQYNDTKGFGNQWNFPSGLLVYNISNYFKAGQNNVFDITRLSDDKLALYTGYIVAVYENATQPSIIKITEETDLLNTESSGYGTNSTTAISYAVYENIDTKYLNSTKLCVVTGAANWPDSNIFLNDKRYGSMSDNWNTTQQMSFSTYDVDNLVNGENVVTLQSVEDNLVIFSTILTMTYDEPLINVTNLEVTSNSNNFFVNVNNTVEVTLKAEGEHSPIELTLKIDDEELTQTVDDINDIKTVDFTYLPTSNGTKNVEVIIKYLNDSSVSAYTGTLTAYYNGYMGKSFTGGENFTTKRVYEGKNTLILEQFNYYNWNDDSRAVYDASALDAGKIVDVLYYQGYNWNKYLNFTLMVNGVESPLIASYSDAKGFGTYNYPSGVMVFNITGQFVAGQSNEIVPTQGVNNSNILYGGILVVVYANNTDMTSIMINEGSDLLNPEASGLTSSDYTVAYANYEGVESGDGVLYVISAASDKADGSKILFNGEDVGCMADNYDSVSKLSIVKSEVGNVVDGDNLVTLQSINDNLFAMGTILVLSYEVPNVVVTDVNVTASKGDLLVDTDNIVSIGLSNDGAPFTGTLNVDVDGSVSTVVLEDFVGDKVVDVTVNPSTVGAKDVKVDIIVDDESQTLYESTLMAYYNGYRGKSFTGGENFTTKRVYEGKNTLILEQFNYYNWNDDSRAVYDASALDAGKIVDVLYYQGYNWNKYLNFTLMVNGVESPLIASYSDAKGFGTYNYPSGVMVFNITGQFVAGQSNEIVPTQGVNNSNILYGGILVVVYANNTDMTSIMINEGSDLLNPEASGLTSSDYTVAYANYEGVESGDGVLYVISAASDKADGSKILFNGEDVGCMADNYDSVSKLSIVKSEVGNVVDGDNLVTLQSINDNLFAMGTILVVSNPIETTLKVDTTEFTAGEKATIQASIYYGNAVLTNLNKGKVSFKVNGKTLKDENGKVIYAKVVNGTAKIENYAIPESWIGSNAEIQAIYSGSVDLDSLKSEKASLNVTTAALTITTNDVTATAGEAVKLTATVTAGNSIINNGKIVFKINGKTVKDENGKVIYAKVVNNQVTVNYTLPEDMKVGDYKLTAVFLATGYDRVEDTKTLTVVEN